MRGPEMLRARFAHQLARPHGHTGRVVGAMLNRANVANIRAAVQALELRPGATAADIGFGGGVGLEELLYRVGPSGMVHGVELSTGMYAHATRRFRAARVRGRLGLHIGSMEALPLGDAALDGIITVNTVYFVPELPIALRELARVLRPSGRLVLGVGDPGRMRQAPLTAHGFSIRDLDELDDRLRAAGLTVIERRRRGDQHMPFHLLVARLERAEATDGSLRSPGE